MAHHAMWRTPTLPSPRATHTTPSSLLAGGVREPGIIAWPGTVAPGRVSAAVAHTTDIFATALALAGVAAPTDRAIDGRDLRQAGTVATGGQSVRSSSQRGRSSVERCARAVALPTFGNCRSPGDAQRERAVAARLRVHVEGDAGP